MRRALRPFSDLVALLRLVRLMRRGGFDVVHTHSSKAGFLGRLAAKWVGVPCVVHTPHTFPFEMDVSPLARWCYVRLERVAARFTDYMVCVCPSQRTVAESLVGAARVAVIENGIAFPQYGGHYAARRMQAKADLGIDPGNFVVGVVGRFAPQKGHAYFIDAARRVAERLPYVRFLLVGDGELREAIERQIVRAGLKDRFIIVGAREDGTDLLPSLDLVVLPSLWEGMPYALLEALAAGKPVIASCVGGMQDVIQDGVNGVLVPPRDPVALAEAMVKVLENPVLGSKIGDRARETVATRYRIEEMIERLSALYEGRNRI